MAPNKIVLCYPTLNRFDLLEKSIIAACKGSRAPDHICIIDNSGGLFTSEGHHSRIEESVKTPISVITPLRNIGVSASWNVFFHLCDDIIVVSNDDTKMHNMCLQELENSYNTMNDISFFYPNTEIASMFSLFMMRKSLFNSIGEFDTNFYPAYFEDNDYHWRMKLQGYDRLCVKDAYYDHATSSTIHEFSRERYRRFENEFNENKEYYIRKWGGEPGYECYNIPFNYAK